MPAPPAPLAGLFAVLPAAAASAAPVPGLNLGGAVSVPELDAGLSTGARSVRLFAPWDALQPAGPGSWNAGLLAQYEADVARLGQVGAKAVIVLTGAPGWAGGSSVAPPSDPQAFAAFAGAFASKLRVAAGRPGVVIGYEVWNEADAGEFWAGAPDAARYAALLKATAPRLRAADPAAKVVLGPTTGNNYGWLAQLYGHGVQGSFDAVPVHPDTACLDRGPDQYYRDNGRLGQFTFLGYREVHATMAAHGDADKPIWMTELGWSA